MTAPTRRQDAAAPTADFRGRRAHGLWQNAIKIRTEWLDHGLSTQPADRRTAEHSLTAIYARIRDPHPGVAPPLASDLAMVSAQLRGALSVGLSHADPELSPARKGKHNEPWPELPPLRALDDGIPLGVVLHQGLRIALHRSLADGFRTPIRTVMAGRGPVPVCWYGQQDAAWVAYYDALHRLGLARYQPDDLDHLGHWAALARSCGWWWPGEDLCVLADRPEVVRAEPLPGTWHDEIRLQRDGARYRDGWRPLTP